MFGCILAGGKSGLNIQCLALCFSVRITGKKTKRLVPCVVVGTSGLNIGLSFLIIPRLRLRLVVCLVRISGLNIQGRTGLSHFYNRFQQITLEPFEHIPDSCLSFLLKT